LPNIKSAKKRVKVTSVKTLRNKMVKSALKTAIKKYEAAVAAGDYDTAAAAYKNAVKKVDQAATKGFIPKNYAAHRKSRFTRELNAIRPAQ